MRLGGIATLAVAAVIGLPACGSSGGTAAVQGEGNSDHKGTGDVTQLRAILGTLNAKLGCYSDTIVSSGGGLAKGAQVADCTTNAPPATYDLAIGRTTAHFDVFVFTTPAERDAYIEATSGLGKTYDVKGDAGGAAWLISAGANDGNVPYVIGKVGGEVV